MIWSLSSVFHAWGCRDRLDGDIDHMVAINKMMLMLMLITMTRMATRRWNRMMVTMRIMGMKSMMTMVMMKTFIMMVKMMSRRRIRWI